MRQCMTSRALCATFGRVNATSGCFTSKPASQCGARRPLRLQISPVCMTPIVCTGSLRNNLALLYYILARSFRNTAMSCWPCKCMASDFHVEFCAFCRIACSLWMWMCVHANCTDEVVFCLSVITIIIVEIVLKLRKQAAVCADALECHW